MTDRASAGTLVTGATGKTGQAVLRALATRDRPAVAFVRGGGKASSLAPHAHLSVVEGDLRRVEDLFAAAEGVDAIYHICPNLHPEEVEIGTGVITAAQAAGVTRVVYHSVLHPQASAMPHHAAKAQVEELLFESGLDFTILQPAAYMQNLAPQWAAILRDHTYRVPYGAATCVSMVDLEDVAEVAARVLAEPEHGGATYELCGADRLDQRQIATAIGRALGRDVALEALSFDDWSAQASAGVPGSYRRQALARMFHYYDTHGMLGGSKVLESLLGRRATTFDDYLRRLVGASGDLG